MRLVDLNPAWGDGLYNGDGYPPSRGIGVWFDCPGQCCADKASIGCDGTGRAINFDPEEGKTKKMRLFVHFANPLDGKARTDTGRTFWQRTGDTFETLTLSPSVDASGFGHWHGWIQGGEIR